MLVYGLVALLILLNAVTIAPLPFDKGICLPSANLWITPGSTANAFLGAVATLGLGFIMMWIVVGFNMLRDQTRLYCGLFWVMMMATPEVSCTFNSGTFLAYCFTGIIAWMMHIYHRPSQTPVVFLIFLTVGFGALTQYGFIGYLPILYMGLTQMRVFSWRSVSASVMGLVAPLWLCYAFGIVDAASFHMPDFSTVGSVLSPACAIHFYVTAGLTALIGITVCITNLINIMSYNSYMRSQNGFVALTLIASVLLPAVDFTNIPFYLMLLTATVAYQLTHMFVHSMRRRSGYLTVLCVVALYFALFVWRLAI